MTPEETLEELRSVHSMDKKNGERLLRAACDYLEKYNYQWNRTKLIETNLAVKFLLLRCLSLELRLANDASSLNRNFSEMEPCGE